MLSAKLRRFRRDEDGTAAIELLFAVPLLLWTLMSTFVYFDAYRAQSISVRAALTIADMYSREETPITPLYMDNARNILAILAESDAQPDYRITVFTYRTIEDDFRLVWGENRGLGPNLDNGDLERMRDRFPQMSNNDRAIMVETVTDYQAPFRTPLMFFWNQGQSNGSVTARYDLDDSITFDNMVIIKPRFTNNYCFDPTPELPTNGDDDC